MAARLCPQSYVICSSPLLDGRPLGLAAAAAGVVVTGDGHGRRGTGRLGTRDFGKGSGHAARLNVGDCFAYALAKSTGEPLLFKGDDFSHTDAVAAVETQGGRRSARPR